MGILADTYEPTSGAQNRFKNPRKIRKKSAKNPLNKIDQDPGRTGPHYKGKGTPLRLQRLWTPCSRGLRIGVPNFRANSVDTADKRHFSNFRELTTLKSFGTYGTAIIIPLPCQHDIYMYILYSSRCIFLKKSGLGSPWVAYNPW